MQSLLPIPGAFSADTFAEKSQCMAQCFGACVSDIKHTASTAAAQSCSAVLICRSNSWSSLLHTALLHLISDCLSAIKLTTGCCFRFLPDPGKAGSSMAKAGNNTSGSNALFLLYRGQAPVGLRGAPVMLVQRQLPACSVHAPPHRKPAYLVLINF